MKTTALRFRTLAIGLALAGSIAASLEAVDAYTDPVGYYTLSIQGASDNVMSLPMTRDAVFSGTVAGGITQPAGNATATFDVLAGLVSPGWTVNQWAYVPTTQPQTYYVEFTSGELKGLFYKVTANAANSITLDTEGDSVTDHDLPNAPDSNLAVGDSFKIRPYWRVKDVFESAGAPIIDPRPNPLTLADEILVPNYGAVGINKAPGLTIYYVAGQGWRGAGQGSTDFADFILRPTESLVVRRRNAVNLNLTNLGGVLMNKSISFIPGGDGSSANDIYFSINRPAPVSLNQSGLRVADQTLSLVKDSPNALTREDEILAFGPGTGFNRAPVATYYYLAGQGWRQASNPSTTIGDDVFLEPGKSYIIRKKAASGGKDWVNDANY